ncbi:MAG TPA: acyltransferase [Acidimicrobiales bacterium]|nr:acyltransferase [Acidimicrobiales bacterium]
MGRPVSRNLLHKNYARAPWKLTHAELPRLASAARRRYLEATHLHAHLDIHPDVSIGPGFRLWMPDDGTLEIGRGTELRHHTYIEIYGDGVVRIGPRCHLTYYTHIASSTSITIGEGASLGLSTVILDGNHRFRDIGTHHLDQGYDFRPITIGPEAMVFSNCTVINDIGHHAVIGANSVVTKPIPPYCIAVGAPARVIEYFGPPEERSPDIPADVPGRRPEPAAGGGG